MTRRKYFHLGLMAMGLMLTGLLSGCTLLKPDPAGEIIKRTEPLDGRRYDLYLPLGYSAERTYGLLVLCPDGLWESSASVLADYAKLADDQSWIMISAPLQGTADWPPSPEQQQQRQEADETLLLSAIAHVQAGYPIDDQQIFISGNLSGTRSALFIGLRRPELFRAVALRQPRFDSNYIQPAKPFIDPYQRVLVVAGMADLARDQALRCIEWLNEADVAVSVVHTAASADRQPDMVRRFFSECLRKHPRLLVQAFRTGSSRTIRFQLQTSLRDIERYSWDFGDKSPTDTTPSPEHRYTAPGEYTIRLQVHSADQQTHERTIRLSITE
ncbi:MAG: hypothetical protein HJJLKODD_02110 [Phycisphaerae bacterium]|nr:hypothetical protein [Phycisphaerae bacterium]